MQRLLSMEKAMRVLDLFSRENPEWGVSEAARTLGFPKSTTSLIMSNLAKRRFLRRVDKRRYRLGWHLFELSQVLLDTTKCRTEARAVMEELSSIWKETTQLAVLDGIQVVYLEKVEGSPAVRTDLSYVGVRLPTHCSALGKVLLASREWEEIAPALEDQGLPALTPNTITDLDRLRDELWEVQEQGYANDEEESMVGLCCVAAPIYCREGEVVAAISLSAPAYRFDLSESKYTRAILEAAHRVSRNIGNDADLPRGFKTAADTA